MVKSPRLLLIGAALLLLAGIRCAQAQEKKIVSLGAYDVIEGPDRSTPDWPAAGARSQAIAHRSEFDALPEGGAWLTEIRFRPDGIVPIGEVYSFGRVQWSLSVTQVDPLDISSTFAANITGTPVEVYNAAWSSTVINPNPPGAEIRPFDLRIPLETPYFYNPAEGNLLTDIIWEMPGSGVNALARFDLDLSNAFSERRDIWSGDLGVDSPVSNGFTFTVINEYVFIPEPSTWNVDAGGNWSLPANWASGVPNITGARAVLGSAITAPRTVTVNTPITVGRLDFDSAHAYTVAGSQVLTLDAMSVDAQINVTSGSHTIAAPVSLADNATITVTPAASSLALTGQLNSFGKTVTKAGAGTLTLNNIHAERLSVNGGTVAVALNGTAASTSVVGSLSIAGDGVPTAKLDLTNYAAVINYAGTSPAATVRQQILAGRGGAGLGKSWNGPGITSSAAAAANATNAESRSVGYAENSAMPLGPLTTYRGQPVDGTSILIGYTRTGDANLDGVVNDDDVTIVGATYAPGVPNAAWALGDFDYNGFVDDDDVTLLGAFYDPSATALGGPPAELGATGGASGVTAVPEPASLILLLLGLAGIGAFVRWQCCIRFIRVD